MKQWYKQWTHQRIQTHFCFFVKETNYE